MNFKVCPTKRKNLKLDEPKSLKTWIVHFISEVFATAVLSFLFAGLFIILPNGHIMLDYLYSGIFISMYSGFVVIGILFVFFLKWSADANPIISIYKTITGVETYRYCGFKIVAQICGGILAGLLVWALTTSATDTAWNIFAPIVNIHHGFLKPHIFSKVGGFLFPFFVEIMVGLILLWSVFSTTFSAKYRLLIVLGMTMFATTIGSAAEIMNFNATRALAQDVGALFTGQMSGNMWITFTAILAGTLITPFLLVFLQWFVGDHLIVWIARITHYKKLQVKQIPNKSKSSVIKKNQKK